ncbi:MAG: type II toxin-antitoxin system RelE/ParE family toxin [Candidatus Omnitrophota bacterium]
MTKSAEKDYLYLYRTNRPIFERIRKSLYSIAENPRQGKPLKFKLKGRWSCRIGVYRIIYTIQHSILTVEVLDIGHRRDAYR